MREGEGDGPTGGRGRELNGTESVEREQVTLSSPELQRPNAASFNFAPAFKRTEDALRGAIVLAVAEDAFNIHRGLIYCVCPDWRAGARDYGAVEVGAGWTSWRTRTRSAFGAIGDRRSLSI